MKKVALILNIVCVLLTLVGVVLVLFYDFNAGYAVIPGVFAIIFNLLYSGIRLSDSESTNRKNPTLLICCMIACAGLYVCAILSLIRAEVDRGIFIILFTSMLFSLEVAFYIKEDPKEQKPPKINYAVLWIPMLVFGGVFGMIAYFILLGLHRKNKANK